MTEPETDYSLVLDSPLGRLGVRLQHGQVCGVAFLPEGASLAAGADAISATIAEQFSAYFQDPHGGFRLPLLLQGTPFQLSVWEALRRIPAGETRSYGELAAQLGTGARAVGNACRRNPVPVIVPCHRVVGSTGVGGYAGHTADGLTLERKRWLLTHEGVDTAALKKRQPAPTS